MDSKIIKAFIGLIAAFILVIAVFGILPQLGMKGPFENFQSPLAGLFEGGKNAAANAALDVSGLKSKAESALRGNADRIAEATGMTSSQVDAAIDTLDIQSWEVTSLPEGAEKTGSANVSYSGTDATITTTVHASRSGVSKNVRAVAISLPIEGFGVARTSAMMPLFHVMPSEILVLDSRNGMNAGRYTYRNVRHFDSLYTRAISSICLSTLSKPVTMLV